MPPRAPAAPPRPSTPPLRPALFAARPFLIGAAAALLVAQASLLLRLSSPPPSFPPALLPQPTGVQSQGDAGDSSKSQESHGQSQEMAALRNVTELAEWAAEIAEALGNVFPEILESPDSFLEHVVQLYKGEDTPPPDATCAIPQQRDRDSHLHSAMGRSIEALALALACSNASFLHSLPRSLRHSHCPSSSSSSSTPEALLADSNADRVEPDPVDHSSTDPSSAVDSDDPYDNAGRTRLAHVLLALHQSSSVTWLSRLLPTWLLPIGWRSNPSRHKYWLGKLAEEWAVEGGGGGGRGGERGGEAAGEGGEGAGGREGTARAVDLGVEGKVGVGLGQKGHSSEGSEEGDVSGSSLVRPAAHGERRSEASRRRGSARGWWDGRGSKTEGRGEEQEEKGSEGRERKYFLSTMAFNRAVAAAAAGGSSEQCQAAVFAIYQWLEYMRYAGSEHFYWYDCARSNAESQAAALSLYSRAALLTYHRLHQRSPPPAHADYHYDQDSSLSHFLEHHRHETKWVAIADVDEYIFMPPDTRPLFLARLLRRRPCAARHPPAAARERLGVGNGWASGGGGEGASEEEEEGEEVTQVLIYNQFFIGYPQLPPSRLTIERFIHRPHRPPDHRDRLRAKMLLQPAAAIGFLSRAPHRALMHSGTTVVADPRFVRLNHYWGKRDLPVNASERERDELEVASIEDRSTQAIADVIKTSLRWLVPVLPLLCEGEAVNAALLDAKSLVKELQLARELEKSK